jgi:TonB family protein
MDSAVSSTYLGSDSVGRTIDGRFPLLRWLGGTERSSVFLTQLDGDPAQKAAIKLNRSDAVDAETRIAQWQTAANLSHPHLMRLFHAGRCEVDGEPLLYAVTEYADEILSEILRERPLTPDEARQMLDPVLDALSWLHSRNLVHGHLRPSNILVVDDRLKLSIDGLHATGEPVARSSASGAYDAPEAARGNLSPPADVWSLGIVLVEALTQRLPVRDGSGSGETVVPASIPPPFSGIVRECLRADPARRATLSGIRSALDGVPAAEPAKAVERTDIAAKRMDRIAATPASKGKPSRTPIMIAVAVLAVIVIAAVLAVGSHRQPPSSQSSAPAAQPQSSTPSIQPPSPAPAPQPHTSAVVKGAVADRAAPSVPQEILNTIQGHVRVRIGVQVDASGNVADASIDSPGPSRYFANRALETARNWKFRPAERDGRAVASQWILEFQFGQDGTTITPTETSP